MGHSSSSQRSHFADPHKLLKTEYDSTAEHTCDICRSKLAGLPGYRCSICNFDIHAACADSFTETVSFFAHPWHELKLSRVPPNEDDDRVGRGACCDLCSEKCPPGSVVYRCVQCGFDVHPACTMLRQTIRSPLHPEHDLCLTPASGHHHWHCKACDGALPVWQYRCGMCLIFLHVACVSGAPSSSCQNGSSSNSQVDADQQPQKQQSTGTAAAGQPTSGTTTTTTKGNSEPIDETFLVKTAITATAGGLASQLFRSLAEAMQQE